MIDLMHFLEAPFQPPFRNLTLEEIKQATKAPRLTTSVAPARGKWETRDIKCAQFLDVTRLDSSQRDDLEIGIAAVEAVWKAVQADTFWCSKDHWPMDRCVLAALIVRDTLHLVGRADASVMPVGLKLEQMAGRKVQENLTIGSPDAPVLAGKWNAHMVVQLGDIIFDPTSGQTQRPWNAAPDSAALLLEPLRGDKIDLDGLGMAKVKARHIYRHAGFNYRVSYFELTRSVKKRTRDWDGAPSLRPERRQSLVQSAVRLLEAEKAAAAAWA